MTALAEYRRLEATGLWRDSPDDQRREVVVSLGDATLMISSTSDSALTHWSLPAVLRVNPGDVPALYIPGQDATEELEIADSDMIAAIEKLRSSIERRRPHPGRLRLILSGVCGAAVLAAAVFWMPGALIRQTAALLPEASRVEIGESLLAEVEQLNGPACHSARGAVARDRLATRVFGASAPRIAILNASIPATLALPGNIMLADAALVEDHETPDVLAGYLLVEDVRRTDRDPLVDLLEAAGLSATLRLLTTGHLPQDALHDHAARLLSAPRPELVNQALVQRFAEAEIATTPYAFARDISGETVLSLIEADPMRGQAQAPLLQDSSWISLQEICNR